MNEEQAELIERIRAFDIDGGDGGGASFSFATRLARENGWSAAQAERAIEEYRRFAFLAVAAGHPVVPSEAVDQVWHLHLTYTRSYWGAFCFEVLRTPLHHEPTRGGAEEEVRLAGWYQATLASYRRLFGHAPPGDLWPDTQDRRRRPARLQWVDRSRRWVLPKPRLSVLALASFALLLLAAGCAVESGGVSSPLRLPGPHFMTFYLASVALALAAAGLIRWGARGRESL